jgi:predicted phosphodiesterase
MAYFKKVYLMGDVHGDFVSVFNYEFDKTDMNDCLVIQLGDFGVGFNYKKYDEENLKFTNNLLLERGCQCYAIRGNHDSPDFFDGNYRFSNLHLLKDYTSMDINGESFLFVGGAVSIDRTFRINRDRKSHTKKSYFFGEEFQLDLEKIKDVKCDVIITHTSPTWCYPQNDDGFGPLVESFIKYDDNLVKDLTKERKEMDILFEELNKSNKIHTHYYGHFHTSAQTDKNGCKHFLIDQYKSTEYTKCQ